MTHMQTTLILDDQLVERARELTGIQQTALLVREGLLALIARESGKKRAALGGSQPSLSNIARRRPA